MACKSFYKKKLFILPLLPFLQGTIVQGQEKPRQPTMSPTGESESIVSVWLPQLCRMLPKRPTTFSPDPEHQSWIVWDSKEQGKGWVSRNWGMKLNKGLWFVITTSENPQRSPPTNLPGCIICSSTQIAYVHHQFSVFFSPFPLYSTLHACPTEGICAGRTLLNWKKIHKLINNLGHSPKEPLRTWPGFVGSREGITSQAFPFRKNQEEQSRHIHKNSLRNPQNP